MFPAAGLGTRFLPATKAQPKEMLPLVDKPIIQYVIEEAVASGLTSIIIVTGKGKNAIEDHFDVSYELERHLAARGQTDLLEQVRAISSMINVSYVRQGEQLGLGHAVLQARDLVGDEPFAVMLGDDIIDAPVPCMKQMMNVFESYGGPVIAVQQVPRDEISAYGVIDGMPEGDSGRLYRIRDMVEKPKAEDAPSDLAIIGRYILTPDIFEELERTPARRGRRDPAHRRPAPAEAAPDALRLPVRGRAPRRRQQARLPEGDRRVRPQARGPGRPLPRVPEVAEPL